MTANTYQTVRELYRVAAITATPAVVTQNDGNTFRKGGHFIIDITAGATLLVTPTVDGFDPSSGKWYNIITGTALAATGTTVLRVYPGLVPATNLTVADVLPSVWRLVMTHGNSNAATYTVSARLFD
jgi:hypothetical protein